jgi:hypothetical protein
MRILLRRSGLPQPATDPLGSSEIESKLRHGHGMAPSPEEASVGTHLVSWPRRGRTASPSPLAGEGRAAAQMRGGRGLGACGSPSSGLPAALLPQGEKGYASGAGVVPNEMCANASPKRAGVISARIKVPSNEMCACHGVLMWATRSSPAGAAARPAAPRTAPVPKSCWRCSQKSSPPPGRTRRPWPRPGAAAARPR